MNDELRISLSNKENVSNKVTSISSSSTNAQYPSAKCVYDMFQPIPISENTDLNDYTEVGVYYCNLQPTELETLINAPSDVTSEGNGFCLFVENTNVYGNGVKQTLTTFVKSNTFVRNFWTDNNDNYRDTGWKPVYEDTGWKDVTFPTGFGHHSETDRVRYRRVGKVVELRGAVKNTNQLSLSSTDTTFTLATIGDTSCRPSKRIVYRQQGSQMNTFLLIIGTDGAISLSRYGTTSVTNVPASSWLNVHTTFLVD